MKKAVIGAVAAMMVLSVGATSVFAAGPGYRRNSADADRTGICGCIKSGCQYIDADNDEVCDRAESRSRYVDADNDGVCDNYTRQDTRQGHCFHGRHNR